MRNRRFFSSFVVMLMALNIVLSFGVQQVRAESGDTEAPSVPVNVQASNVTAVALQLTWGPSTDNEVVAGYDVYQGTELLGTVTSATYAVNGLQPSTTYMFSVSAKDAQGNASERSAEITVTTDAPAADTQPPTAPTNVTVTGVTYHEITLSWSTSSDDTGVSQYNVYKGDVLAGSTSGAATGYTLSGLASGTSYSLHVTAKDAAGNESAASSVVQTVTLGQAPEPFHGALSASPGFTLTVAPDGTVESWGGSASGELEGGSFTSGLVPASLNFSKPIKAIAGGVSTRLALADDGTVWSWGWTSPTTIPFQIEGLHDIIAIAVGDAHSLALQADGGVWSWGENSFGQLGDGTYTNRSEPVRVLGLTDVTAISASANYSVALKSDGTVWNWGIDGARSHESISVLRSTVPVQVVGLDSVSAISAGGMHTLALKHDGTVWSWGANTNGELGNGGFVSRNVPGQVNEITDVVAIAAGGQYSLAVRSDGTLWAWGANQYGQLGDGTTVGHPLPVNIPSLSAVLVVSAGQEHSAVIANDGRLYTWGRNEYGQLGTGTLNNSSSPTLIASLINADSSDTVAPTAPVIDPDAVVTPASISIKWAASTDNSLIRSYMVYCNSVLVGTVDATTMEFTISGLAPNTLYAISVRSADVSGNFSNPSAVLNASTVSGLHLPVRPTIEADNVRTLALLEDGNVWGWGTAQGGNFGDGILADHMYSQPTLLSNLTSVSSISMGMNHNLALKTDGTVWAWGSNSHGELGIGLIHKYQTKPVIVPGLRDVISIFASNRGSVALKNDGTVWTWGNVDTNDSLGSEFPEKVAGLNNIISVKAGTSYYLALDSDGNVWTWGVNNWGELGDGTTISRTTPAKVVSLNAIVSIAVEASGAYAVKSDGSVWYWGRGAYALQPEQLSDVGPAVSVTSNGNNVLVLNDNGTLRVWGSNQHGELGDGTLVAQTAPGQLLPLHNIIGTSMGSYHSVAWSSDGTIYTWGDNTYGQLGGNQSTLALYPVALEGFNIEISDNVPPTAPSNLHSASITDTAVTISWGAALNSTGTVVYDVYQDNQVLGTTNATFYTINGLSTEVDSSFWVKARNMAGLVSIPSNIVVVKVDGANLLTNGGFEQESENGIPAGWMSLVSSGASGSFSGVSDAGGIASGSGAQLVSGSALNAGDVTMLYQFLNVDAGKTFSASGKFDVLSLSQAVVQFYVDFSDVDDHYLGSYVKEIGSVSGGYITLFSNGTIPPGAKHARVYAILRSTGVGGAGSFRVDDMNFVQGGASVSVPAIPAHVDVAATTSTSVDLSWPAAEESFNVVTYDVYQGSALIGTTSENHYIVNGRSVGTMYTFFVQAKDSTGYAYPASEPTNVYTDGANLLKNSGFETNENDGAASGWLPVISEGATGLFSDVTNEPAVGGHAQQVSGSDMPNGSVVLLHQFLDVAGGKPFTVNGRFHVTSLSNAIVQLYVDFSDTNDNYLTSFVKTQITTTGGYITLFNHGQIPAGSKHARVYVILRSTADHGSGSFLVDDVSFTQGVDGDSIPSVPEHIFVTAKTETTVQLSWEASNDDLGVVGYDIYQGGLFVGVTADTNYTISGLDAGTTYSFAVQARNAAGNISAPAAEINVQTDGANLLMNGGFESEGSDGVSAGWVKVVSPGTGSSFTFVTNQVASGGRAQQVNGTELDTGDVVLIHQYFDVDGDKLFEVSGKFFVLSLDHAVAQLHVDFSDVNDSYLESSVTQLTGTTDNFTTLSNAGTIPVGAKHARVYAILRGTADHGSGSFLVDDMTFVQRTTTNNL